MEGCEQKARREKRGWWARALEESREEKGDIRWRMDLVDEEDRRGLMMIKYGRGAEGWECGCWNEEREETWEEHVLMTCGQTEKGRRELEEKVGSWGRRQRRRRGRAQKEQRVMWILTEGKGLKLREGEAGGLRALLREIHKIKVSACLGREGDEDE